MVALVNAPARALGATAVKVGLAAALLSACFVIPTPPVPDVHQSICLGTVTATASAPLADNAVAELSGIVASRTYPDTWYAHNDSGDTNRIFAINSTGATLATYTITGASAIDWEDIAIGPGPTPGVTYIYVADIGDNNALRATVDIYRFAEPTLPSTNGTYSVTGVDVAHLSYSDGPRDAEALIVDPRNGQLTVIEKRLSGGSVGVYRAAANLADGASATLNRVSTLALGTGLSNAVTAADMSANSKFVVVRTYGGIRSHALTNPASTTVQAALANTPCTRTIATELQGEALGIRPDGSGLVTVAEGAHPSLHFLNG